jgi:exopolysaccharide production protein ExoQ
MDRQKDTSLKLGYLISIIAFTAFIFGFIAPKGMAPLVIFGGLAGLIYLKRQGRSVNWLNKFVIVIFICLCLWAALSIFWSIDRQSAAIGTIKLIGNLMAGGILFSVMRSLNDAESYRALRWLLIGYLFIFIVVVLEILLDSPIYSLVKAVNIANIKSGEPFWLNIIVGILAFFIWPLSLAFGKNIVLKPFNRFGAVWIICGFAIIFYLAFLVKYPTGVIALSSGIIGAAVIWLFGRRAAVALSIILVVVGLSLPLVIRQYDDPVSSVKSVVSIPFSAEHRIKIWEFTTEKISQKWFGGWGMNASKDIPGGQRILYAKSGLDYGKALPLHPHNTILQLWLELGLPGIIMYLGLGVFIFVSAVNHKRSKFESSMIIGQFITILVIANLSFGVWQAWWMATLWLSAALMVMVLKTVSVQPIPAQQG